MTGTIVDVLRRRALTQPDRRAYTFLDDGEVETATLTYAQLDRRSRAIAVRLQEAGAEGRRVLLTLDSGLEFVAAYLGCLYAGAVAVPAYRPSPVLRQEGLPRLRGIARDAAIELILSDDELPESVRSVMGSSVRFVESNAVPTELADAWTETPLDAEELAFLQYTSGSTAEPRGVMVSHRNLMHNLAHGAEAEGNDRGSVSVSWLPMHHDMGLIDGILQPLFSGFPAYVFSPAAFLTKPLRWLSAISRYRATNSGAPNFAFELCIRKTSPAERASLDLSSWRVAYSGAEPVRAETLCSFLDAFRPCGFQWSAFYPVYGLAEATVLVTSRWHEEPPVLVMLDQELLVKGQATRSTDAATSVLRVGSGQPHRDTKLVIADPQHRRRCGAGEVGEIWLASASVCDGYWNDSEESERTFRAFLEDTKEGPFLRTGDLGFVLDGELFVTGRMKDVLIVRGVNYSPSDIEWTAEEAHPGVRGGGVAVLGTTGDDGEQAALLAEVKVDWAMMSAGEEERARFAAEIMQSLRAAILEHHGLHLATIALVPPRTLLKTSSGKLRRSACGEAFDSGKMMVLARSGDGDALSQSDSIEPKLRDLVAELSGAPVASVDLRSSLARYVDSLGVVEVQTAVGKWVGWDVSIAELLEPGALQRLQGQISDSTGTAKRRPRRSTRLRGSELALMLADSCLPKEIRPDTRGASRDEPRSILLTGATGFFGAYLLKELLESTRAQIVCLVRGEGGGERIRANLESQELWSPSFEGRIVPLEGDLSEGLNEFEELAQTIDAIYHNAAAVNFVYPYRDLRDVNVLGTRELLRLACHGKAKPFHFVSTLGVCYATRASELPEVDDVLPFLPDLQLGYAESKCVAEALVREAAERGLPASVYRLALLTGSDVSGRTNENDFLSRFVRGCIEMETAPDLDVQLDGCPVDYASRAVVALSLEPAEKALSVHHIRNPKPRHWRELVLWMNLFGYSMKFAEYREWLSRLQESATTRDHALHHLQPFFARSVTARDGQEVFLPELYEESRKTQILNEKTDRRLARRGVHCPESGPSYLDRTYTSFIDRGVLATPPRRRDRDGGSAPVDEWLQTILCKHFDDASLDVLDLALEPVGVEQSILTELTSWYSIRETGLYRATARFRTADAQERTLRLFLKVKPSDDDVLDVAQVVADLCSSRLGELFDRFGEKLSFTLCHRRELALYEQDDARLRDFMPALYGTIRDDAEGLWALALEDLSGLALLDSADDAKGWSRASTEAAIRGLANIHAVWYGREAELERQEWLGPVVSSASLVEMTDLWQALSEHARPWFRDWAGDSVVAAQEQSVADVDMWSEELMRMPRTLIHNDFNSRNLAFRRGNGAGLELCAYDWEPATLGVPQHDLAELLCFVLSPSATKDELRHYVALHRRLLEEETEASIDVRDWQHGFTLSLEHLLVSRLPMYTLLYRFQRKRFLERVIPTWLRLFQLSQHLGDVGGVYDGQGRDYPSAGRLL